MQSKMEIKYRSFLFANKRVSVLVFRPLSLCVLWMLCMTITTSAQSPPAPCTDGNQPTCACETAPILCTVDELNGYEYSMTTFQHPGDGPSPLCSAGGVPDNPTWFSFIAWCSDLTLQVTLSNCTDMCGNRTPCGTGAFPCGIFGGPCSFGVQAVVYASCNYTGEVACVVDECGENQFNISMTGLEIGGTYHLILDGCNGSACDVRINVVGVCGSAEIEPWSNPIQGPEQVCLEDTPIYTVDNLQAASNYHWYIDGVEVAVTGTNFFSVDWPGVGVFELCVDASNDPCIPVENEPGQICITVTVGVVDPEDPEPAEICIGSEYFYPPNGISYPPGQYEILLQSIAGCDSTIILTVLEIPTPQTDLGIFYLCGEEQVEVGDQFYISAGFYSVILPQEQEPFCDSIVEFLIETQYADAGSFLGNQTIYCPGEIATIQVVNFAQEFYHLQYLVITDLDGWVIDIISGGNTALTSDICGQGYRIFSYNISTEADYQIPSPGTFFDLNYCLSVCCDIQEISIVFEDTEPPIFTIPPTDITLLSIDELGDIPILGWTDNCTVAGMSSGVQTGSYDPCEGGLFERIWEAIDDCENSTTHIQVITILPNPEECVDPCTIEVQNLIIGECNNNNTGFDEADDFFSISFSVVVLEGEVDNLFILIDGAEKGPFNYSSTIVLDSLPANGSTILIELFDLENTVCDISFEVSLDPCSSCEQTVDAGDGGIITCLDREVQLNGSSSESGIFSWEGPDGFESDISDPVVDRPGIYQLTVFFDAGCFFSDFVEITEEAGIPSADAGENARLDCNVSSVQIGGSGTSMTPGLLYEWTDQNGNIIGNTPILDIDMPGTFTLRVIDESNGCISAPSTVFVTEDRIVPNSTILIDPSTQLDCRTTSILLSPQETEDYFFQWVTSSSTIDERTLEVTEPGVIRLIVLNEDTGCSSEEQVTITQSLEHPELTINQPEPINCLNDGAIIVASINSTEEVLVTWSQDGMLLLGQNDIELSVQSAGAYTITVENITNGCVSTESILILDLRETIAVSAGSNLSFSCLDTVDVIQLSGSVAGLQPNWTISWTSINGVLVDFDEPLRPIVEGSGAYILRVENESTGCFGVDTVTVVLNEDAPQINAFEVNDILCEGDIGAIVLTDFDGGTAPFEILFNQNSVGANGIFQGLLPGNYEIQIIDALGCEANISVVINEPNRLELNISGVTFMEPGDTIVLEGMINIPLEEIGWVQWEPEQNVDCDTCLTTAAFPTSPTTFRLYVEDLNGCPVEDSLFILLRKTFKVFIPNAFTPNGDGINDFFTLFSDESIVSIRFLEIFDRWGSMVFSRENFLPNEPILGWDGMIKNQRGMPGTYVYHFNVEREDGVFQSYSGEVVLLR